jgi:hypothetical protein
MREIPEAWEQTLRNCHRSTVPFCSSFNEAYGKLAAPSAS